MRFLPTPLSGLYVIEPEPIGDERGLFARTYCQREFAANGLNTVWPQCNFSFNRQRGTLRGMHYQTAPHGEVKLVRCTRGRVWDVAVDLRPGSPTHGRWHGVVLSEENRLALYIPEEFAHGFITLEDDSELFYMMSEFYHAESAQGVRWDDPAFAIDWPQRTGLVMAPRDLAFPLLKDCG